METFLVRLWLPEPANEGVWRELRGVVEWPGKPESHPFRGDDELLATLRGRLAEARETTETPREERTEW